MVTVVFKTSWHRITRSLWGLQFRTTAFLTVVVLVATALTGITYRRLSEHLVLSQTERHASDLVKAVASAGARAVQRKDRERLLDIAQELIANQSLVYIIFTDVSGHMIAGHQRGAGLISSMIIDEKQRVSVEPINRPQLIELESIGPHVDVVFPVASADDISGVVGLRPTVGFVRVGVSLAAATQQIRETTRSTIGLAVGIALLMVPLGYEIVRRLVRPLNELREGAQSLAAGDLTAQVSVHRRDEFGDLARAFNVMADRLSVSHKSLIEQSEKLEHRVQERTKELETANRQLQEAAARDSLTGLYNRRHFSDILGQLFAESVRYQTDLTCMMIDLDNFKRVNDSLGHQTGDQLLVLTAGAIRSCIRESDVAVRYGGDEFAVLLPRTSPYDARVLAERLLQRFRDDVGRELPEASIASLSVGLASREEKHPASAKVLLRLADEAMYLAKAGGKDRITVVRPVAPEMV